MRSLRVVLSGMAILSLAGCGRADASGLYLSTAPGRVTLVQLIETPDGKVTGRIAETTINSDGTLKDTSFNEDGAISGHDLILKPASVWYGGIAASGSISDNGLTLTGEDFTLTAGRSTLARYQNALTALRSVAAADQHRIAAQKAVQRAEAEQNKAVADFASKRDAITAATNRLRSDNARIKAAIDRSPDFERVAASYTARIARMVQVAPTLSDEARGQLSVAANQVEVATNQVEVARSQYAIGLNQIVQDATPLVAALDSICGSSQAAAYAAQCNEARSAITDIKTTIAHGRSVFTPYRAEVQAELDQQAAMIQKIGG